MYRLMLLLPFHKKRDEVHNFKWRLSKATSFVHKSVTPPPPPSHPPSPTPQQISLSNGHSGKFFSPYFTISGPPSPKSRKCLFIHGKKAPRLSRKCLHPQTPYSQLGNDQMYTESTFYIFFITVKKLLNDAVEHFVVKVFYRGGGYASILQLVCLFYPIFDQL